MSVQRKSPLKLCGGLALAGLGTPSFWPTAADALQITGGIKQVGGAEGPNRGLPVFGEEPVGEIRAVEHGESLLQMDCNLTAFADSAPGSGGLVQNPVALAMSGAAVAGVLAQGLQGVAQKLSLRGAGERGSGVSHDPKQLHPLVEDSDSSSDSDSSGPGSSSGSDSGDGANGGRGGPSAAAEMAAKDPIPIAPKQSKFNPHAPPRCDGLFRETGTELVVRRPAGSADDGFEFKARAKVLGDSLSWSLERYPRGSCPVEPASAVEPRSEPAGSPAVLKLRADLKTRKEILSEHDAIMAQAPHERVLPCFPCMCAQRAPKPARAFSKIFLHVPTEHEVQTDGKFGCLRILDSSVPDDVGFKPLTEWASELGPNAEEHHKVLQVPTYTPATLPKEFKEKFKIDVYDVRSDAANGGCFDVTCPSPDDERTATIRNYFFGDGLVEEYWLVECMGNYLEYHASKHIFAAKNVRSSVKLLLGVLSGDSIDLIFVEVPFGFVATLGENIFHNDAYSHGDVSIYIAPHGEIGDHEQAFIVKHESLRPEEVVEFVRESLRSGEVLV